MKKLIRIFFLLFVVCFSFFYTDKIIDLINKNNPLMIEISNVKSDYDIIPVNAVIDDDTIIPGVKGRNLDIDKSYENMKISGIFREDALVFRDLFPSDSLKDNKDKYIIKGNQIKNEVAVIIVFNNNYIDKINELQEVTVFVNHKDLNINNINMLKDKEVYTYGNNGVYMEEALVSDNTLINRLSNNESKYCLTKNKNDSVLDICSKNNMYTVIPNIVGGYYNVKKDISNGSIILLDSLNNVNDIIKYIRSKGYDIVTLSKLLSE